MLVKLLLTELVVTVALIVWLNVAEVDAGNPKPFGKFLLITFALVLISLPLTLFAIIWS